MCYLVRQTEQTNVPSPMPNELQLDEEPEANSLGELLRKARESKGLTLTEAHVGAGVSRAFLWELETGRNKNPSTRTCRKLADFYGIKLTDLLSEQSSGRSAVVVISRQQMMNDYDSLPARQQQEVAAVIRSLAENNRRIRNSIPKRLTRPRGAARQQKEHRT